MKITTFILLVACLKVSATANAQQVTLSQKNVSIEKVFKEIKKQIGYSFLYTDELLQKASKVTVEVKNTPLKLVLDQLFINQPLSYVIVDQTIIVKNKAIVTTALETPGEMPPPIKITGKITGENNKPLEAVSVIIKGTKLGTSTNADGVYSITVAEPGVVLVFSSIGYETKEVRVGSNTDISFAMVAKSTKMDEIVVVGYGSQKKKDVTGAVVSIGEKALKEIPAPNLQQALQGQAAGLEVQKVGSKPGAGAVIRIRGERTISGSNDPLLVLDGIPFEGGNINDINPNDIASIEVLKDASATAIYGSRGSNGVILVTTKRGKQGDTRITFNDYYGINTVAKKYPVMNATQYQAMRDVSNWTAGYLADELANKAKGVNTDWQDLMYGNGFVTDNSLTVSGGANGNAFSLGGGYYKEKSVLPGQDFGRYSLRATIDTKIGKILKVGLNSLNTVTITNGGLFVNPMFNILAASPLYTPYDSLGNLVLSPYGNTDDKVSTYNPVLLKNNNNNWVDRIRRFRTFNSLYAEAQLAKGLKYRLNVGIDFRQQENNVFQSSDTKLKPSFFRAGKGNTASVNNIVGNGYTVENVLTYDKEIKKHKINFTGLYSVQQDFSHNTAVSKDSIDEDFIQFYNLGQANASNNVKPVVSGSETTWGLVSYMARINYAYDSKYLLTITGRIDGSSRLAEGNKYHRYPAISAGWVISNESFMKNINVVNSLKLRAGWGETSNQSINPYASLGNIGNLNDLYGSSAGGIIRYNFGPTIVTGYNVLNLPNPTLDWEYTRNFNIGLDFAILKNRITGSFEYYSSHTNKILYGISLPPTSGITRSYVTNIGEMSNKGFEATISSVNISESKPKGFRWTTDFNIFWNRNKLLALTSGFTQNVASQLFIGQPLTAIYDYKKLGIWQKSEAQEALKYGTTPGSVKLADLNGDGKIDANNDRSVIGNSQADWQGGMTNRFSYKGFDFSFMLYARMGGLLVSQVYQPYASYMNVLDGKRNNMLVNYWTPTNASNDFPAPSAMSSATLGLTTLGYYDASFVKMRSINLGYTFDDKLLKSIHAQSVRFYLSIYNPFVLYSPYMKMGGVDPEATGTGNQGVQDPGNLSGRALTIGLSTPPTRSFNLGLNITF